MGEIIEEKKYKKKILIIAVIIIIAVVLIHPWTQFIAQQRAKEISPEFEAVLTDWQPFGNSFKIQWFSPTDRVWITFGNGFVDIFGRTQFDGPHGLINGSEL
jgi:hypothetical protein